MNKGTVNIPITHYNDLKSTINKWEELHTQAIKKISEIEDNYLALSKANQWFIKRVAELENPKNTIINELRKIAETPDVYDVEHEESMLYLSEVIHLINNSGL